MNPKYLSLALAASSFLVAKKKPEIAFLMLASGFGGFVITLLNESKIDTSGVRSQTIVAGVRG